MKWIAFFAVLLVAGFSFSLTNINTCAVLSSAGETYELTSSVSGAPNPVFIGNACIVISASNVIFDCKGFSISNNGTAGVTYGIAINGSVSNVTVRNCPAISNYNDRGIYAYLTNNSLITNVTTNGSIYLESSYFNRVANSTCNGASFVIDSGGQNNITNNTAVNGEFALYSATGNLVDRNTASGTWEGYDIDSSSTLNTFSNNIVHDAVNQGFYLEVCDANVFINNTVYNSGGYGFYLEAATNSNLTNNRVFNNTGEGIYADGYSQYNIFINNSVNTSSDGFYMNTGLENVFINNTANDNANNGFYFDFNSDGNNLTGNRAFNNVYGFNVDGSSNNLLANGSAYSNTFGFYILDGNNSRLINNSAYSNTHGISFLGVSVSGLPINFLTGNNASGNSGSGILLNSSTSNKYNVSFVNNVITNNPYGIWIPNGYANANLRGGNLVANNTLSGYQLDNYFGDVLDFSGDRFLGNGKDANFSSGGSSLQISITDVIFGNAAGAYGANTSISHSTSSRTYGIIDWVPSPVPPSAGLISLLNKSVNVTPSRLEFSGNYDIAMKWNSTEAGGADSTIQMWLTNTSGNFLLNSSPNVPGRTIFASVPLTENASSIVSLFYNPNCMVVSSSGIFTQTMNYIGAPNPAFSGYACVVILSSDVVYDCNGYTITNNGTGGTTHGIAFNSSFNNVTVRNCPGISGYSIGISTQSASNSLITNSTFFNNSLYGVIVNGGSSVTIANSTARNNSNSGFFLVSTTNSLVRNCTAYGNSAYGFILQSGSTGNSVNNNTAYSNSIGFGALIGSNGNTFSNSTAYSNSNTGFYVDTSNNTQLVNNSAYNGAQGFNLVTASQSTLTNNTARDNSQNGIYITTSTGTNLTSNTVYNNAVAGTNIPALSSGTIIRFDHYYNNGLDFQISAGASASQLNMSSVIFDSASGTYLNYTNLSINDSIEPSAAYSADWSPVLAMPDPFRTPFAGKFVNISTVSGTPSIDSIFWTWLPSEVTAGYNESRFELWKYNSTGWSLQNGSPSLSAHALSLSSMNPASVYAILNASDNCPVITAPGTNYVQSGNFLGAPNDASPRPGVACVKIAASNVVYDCNGYNITNNGTLGAIGILLNSSLTNVTVKNCPRVSGYDYGIYTYISDGNRIINNTVMNTAYYGIMLHASSNNNVTDTRAFNQRTGFFVTQGTGNILVNNNATNNSDAGYYFQLNSDGNTLTNNYAQNTTNLSSPNGYGFYIENSDNNVLNNNKAYNNIRGIYLEGANGNNLTGNNVSTCNADAISIHSASNNRLVNNYVSGCSVGVYLATPSSTNNLLLSNTLAGGAQYGVELVSAGGGNNITLNNASGYIYNGFYVLNTGASNYFSNNTAFNNPIGFNVTNSNNSRYESNTVLPASTYGFSLYQSSGNNLTGNTVTSCTNYGIQLASSGNNRIVTENVTGCNQGIRLESSSDGNLVDLNTVQSNTNFGILVLNSQQNNVTRNNASLNNYGIYVSASNNRVLGNNASSNAQTGIYVTGSGSSYNLVADNIASSNTNYGIHVSSGGNNYNNLTNNSANLNGYGIRVEASQYCVLRNNSADSNTNYGFYIGTAAHNTLADNNFARNNGQTGFYLDSVSNCNLTGNGAFDNPARGFYLSGGSNNYFGSNTANASNTCFHTTGSSNNVFVNDNASDCSYRGFFFQTSSGTSVASSQAHNNFHSGFETDSSADSAFSGLVSEGNQYGFVLWSGSDNDNVSDSAFYNNSGVSVSSGIYAYGSTNVRLSNVSLYSNDPQGLLLENDGSVIVERATIYDNAAYGALVQSSNSRFDAVHLYNNVADFEVNGTGVTVNLSGVSFDNPAGDYTNYTNLSLNDTLASESYLIRWIDNSTTLPLPVTTTSFRQKFVSIEDLAGNATIDSIVWSWLDSELPGYTESNFAVYEYDGLWTITGATLSTAANTLSLSNLNGFSAFAILQYAPSTGGEPSEEPSEEGYSVSIKPACQGFIVTVKDGGTPVENALVTGTDETDAIELTPRYTNSSGQAFFPDCDIDVSVKAAKSGRQGTDSGMASCGFCPECATDDDCADSEQCSSQQCVPVNCPDGRVVGHACELYECVEDSDCPVGQSCIDHRCKTVYECTYGLANTTADDNADCADNEYCDVPVGQPGGSCKPITGCGDIRNHAITMWECGDLEGCPSCNAGELCITHKCVQGDLTCPASGIVGDSKTCQAKEDGLPCLNCDYVVTDPTGKNFTGQTDGKGNLNLPLKLAGNYKVTLLKDGQVVKTLLVKALPKSPPVEPEKPAAGGLDPLLGGLFLVILLALGLVAIMYWRRRGGKKKPAPPKK